MTSETPSKSAGHVPAADRFQRLVIGGALMLLTINGLSEEFGWRGTTALILQTDLMITGLIGWCPIYWTCRINRRPPEQETAGH